MGISFLLEKKDFFSYSKFKGKIDHFLCNIVCVCIYIRGTVEFVRDLEEWSHNVSQLGAFMRI